MKKTFLFIIIFIFSLKVYGYQSKEKKINFFKIIYKINKKIIYGSMKKKSKNIYLLEFFGKDKYCIIIKKNTLYMHNIMLNQIKISSSSFNFLQELPIMFVFFSIKNIKKHFFFKKLKNKNKFCYKITPKYKHYGNFFKKTYIMYNKKKILYLSALNIKNIYNNFIINNISTYLFSYNHNLFFYKIPINIDILD